MFIIIFIIIAIINCFFYLSFKPNECSKLKSLSSDSSKLTGIFTNDGIFFSYDLQLSNLFFYYYLHLLVF